MKQSGLAQLTGARTFDQASLILSRFVFTKATEEASKLGFWWAPMASAPNNYDDLLAAYRHSVATGDMLPVSNENTASVIFTPAEVNFANRFLHDVRHVQHGLSFDLIDEIDLAHRLLAELEAAGFGPGTLPWRMWHADMVGQAYMLGVGKAFPVDQERFVQEVVLEGLDLTIVDTARRQRAG